MIAVARRSIGTLMTKNDINLWLDAVLLAIFTVLCWAGTVVQFVFPPGPEADGYTIWGWDYEQWSNLQFALLAALALAVLLHVMLHWSWVCAMVVTKLRKRRGAAALAVKHDGSRTLWGVGLLILVFHAIAVGVAAAALNLQSPSP
jgi:hypothetical protein